MYCKLCQSVMNKSHNATILAKYDISYFHCPNCQFIQTEEEHWLTEAYQDSINLSDTGYMQRNLALSKVVSTVLAWFFPSSPRCLDYAGGYGVFVRLMRDIGYDFYWQDKYTENLFARGFEVKEQHSFDVITSFESFEHFDQPLQEIETMLNLSNNILFSTVLYGDKVPESDWHYFGLEHGQHISFYNLSTLKFLAQKYKLNLYSDKKSIHFLTNKTIHPLLFYVLVKIARLGLGDFLALFKKSKTLSDWQLMREK
ncbi:MAG: class I SAM-dependent methyltransferase [Pseudomonadota bacterium]